MNEQDEKMLRRFFSEASHETIADDGFTEQVMRRLPMRRSWLQRLWTPFCVVTFAVLFVVFDGWTLLADHLSGLLRPLLHTLLHVPLHVSVTSMLVILFSLLFVGVGEKLSSEW